MSEIAKSLGVLRDQVNHIAPGRSKRDDGWLGDSAHASRTSDHNPNNAGVVCALDLTHDPSGGFDSYNFAEVLKQNRDERIKYVISNKKIFYGYRSPSHSGDPSSCWKWEKYTGDNPHDKHVHVSVGDARYYDKEDHWVLDVTEAPISPDDARPVLKRGSTGAEVKTLQQLLLVDGFFGPVTENAVEEFQSSVGITPDGVVGLMTWAALLGGAPADDGWQTDVTATVFGGAGDAQRSAYDGRSLGDTALYASLPARLSGDRLIDLRGPAGTVLSGVHIEDIGPWLTDDPYWANGARPLAEDTSKALPRGPNRGKHSNGAGIDLSPAAARKLGIEGKGKVDWRFHTAATAPGATPKGAAPPEVLSAPPPTGGTNKMDASWTLLRYTLIAVGTFLGTKGYLDPKDVETLTSQILGLAGPAMALGTALWGVYVRYKTRSVPLVTAMRSDVPTVSPMTGQIQPGNAYTK